MRRFYQPWIFRFGPVWVGRLMVCLLAPFLYLVAMMASAIFSAWEAFGEMNESFGETWRDVGQDHRPSWRVVSDLYFKRIGWEEARARLEMSDNELRRLLGDYRFRQEEIKKMQGKVDG